MMHYMATSATQIASLSAEVGRGGLQWPLIDTLLVGDPARLSALTWIGF